MTVSRDYHEVTPPKRLVMTTTVVEDDASNPRPEMLNTLIFAELDGKTKLTLRAVVVRSTPAAAEALSGMREG